MLPICQTFNCWFQWKNYSSFSNICCKYQHKIEVRVTLHFTMFSVFLCKINTLLAVCLIGLRLASSCGLFLIFYYSVTWNLILKRTKLEQDDISKSIKCFILCLKSKSRQIEGKCYLLYIKQQWEIDTMTDS